MKAARPYVVCHMVTSLDGKIHPSRWGTLRGRKSTGDLFETTAARFKIGAWIVGSVTIQEMIKERGKLPRAGQHVERGDFVATTKTKRYAIATDSKSVLRFTEGTYQGDHLVMLLTERASNDYLAHLRLAGVSYLFCGARAIELPLAMQKLRSVLGIKKLMVQGGGTFNGAMLQLGLVDELSLVFAPVVDGGGALVSGFCDVPGKTPSHAIAHLRLTSRKQLPGGVSWQRYRVEQPAKAKAARKK